MYKRQVVQLAEVGCDAWINHALEMVDAILRAHDPGSRSPELAALGRDPTRIIDSLCKLAMKHGVGAHLQLSFGELYALMTTPTSAPPFVPNQLDRKNSVVRVLGDGTWMTRRVKGAGGKNEKKDSVAFMSRLIANKAFYNLTGYQDAWAMTTDLVAQHDASMAEVIDNDKVWAWINVKDTRTVVPSERPLPERVVRIGETRLDHVIGQDGVVIVLISGNLYDWSLNTTVKPSASDLEATVGCLHNLMHRSQERVIVGLPLDPNSFNVPDVGLGNTLRALYDSLVCSGGEVLSLIHI